MKTTIDIRNDCTQVHTIIVDDPSYDTPNVTEIRKCNGSDGGIVLTHGSSDKFHVYIESMEALNKLIEGLQLVKNLDWVE